MQHLLYKNFIVKRQKKIRKYNNYKSTRYCMKIKKIKFHKKIIMLMNILFNKLHTKKDIILLHLEYKNVIVKKSKKQKKYKILLQIV